MRKLFIMFLGAFVLSSCSFLKKVEDMETKPSQEAPAMMKSEEVMVEDIIDDPVAVDERPQGAPAEPEDVASQGNAGQDLAEGEEPANLPASEPVMEIDNSDPEVEPEDDSNNQPIEEEVDEGDGQ